MSKVSLVFPSSRRHGPSFFIQRVLGVEKLFLLCGQIGLLIRFGEKPRKGDPKGICLSVLDKTAFQCYNEIKRDRRSVCGKGDRAGDRARSGPRFGI